MKLVIYARDPTERVKTRLKLAPDKATELYAAMLHDVVNNLRGFEPELWYANNIGPDFGLETRAQQGADLGARMANTFDVLLAHHPSVIIVGSDAPTLPPRCVEQAQQALRQHNVVLGPSADGGYYLIGARQATPSFAAVRWSSSHTLADTLRANADACCIEPWYDVDRPDDLRLLAAHLAEDPSAAPATAHVLG